MFLEDFQTIRKGNVVHKTLTAPEKFNSFDCLCLSAAN